MKKKKFEKYLSSGMTYDDYKDILDNYLGKEEKMYWNYLGREVYARPKRWCDIPYKKIVEATQDLCVRELECSEDLGEDDMKDIADHWSDIMADWVSESELLPRLKKH